MKLNLYVPDELGERAKAQEDLNLSALLQEAVTRELDRRVRLLGLDDGMTTVDVDVTNPATGAVAPVRFIGKCIAQRFYGPIDIALYLTRRHRFAVVIDDQAEGRVKVDDYDSLDDAERAGVDLYLLAEGAAELGELRPAFLDI